MSSASPSTPASSSDTGMLTRPRASSLATMCSGPSTAPSIMAAASTTYSYPLELDLTSEEPPAPPPSPTQSSSRGAAAPMASSGSTSARPPLLMAYSTSFTSDWRKDYGQDTQCSEFQSDTWSTKVHPLRPLRSRSNP